MQMTIRCTLCIRWQDRCLQIRLAAQELLVAELKNLEPKGRKHLVELWGAYLPKYGDPPFQSPQVSNEKNSSNHDSSSTSQNQTEPDDLDDDDLDEDDPDTRGKSLLESWITTFLPD